MRTAWQAGTRTRAVTAPLSLIVTAFAQVTDVRRALTPEIAPEAGPTELLLVDLGVGKNRLGGSASRRSTARSAPAPPDLDDPARLAGFFAAMQEFNAAGLLARVPRSQRRWSAW